MSNALRIAVIIAIIWLLASIFAPRLVNELLNFLVWWRDTGTELGN